jgi:hypothetical protein
LTLARWEFIIISKRELFTFDSHRIFGFFISVSTKRTAKQIIFIIFHLPFDLSQRDEHFGLGGLIHTLTESVQKIGQSEAWKRKILNELKSIIFAKKVTPKISANLDKVKGPFTILTKVDHRVSVKGVG